MIRRCRSFLWQSGHRLCAGGGTSHLGGRSLCSSSNSSGNKALEPAGAVSGEEGMTREEAYRRIHDLDFMTATRILFTAPPKKKKFGLDFHLVQLFFACMPSLAVYLVAQYARYEIRRMEAEAELKKKTEEEEEARRAEEAAAAKEREMVPARDGPEQELANVKVRLDALEEAVKGIAVETKRISHGDMTKDQKGQGKEPASIAARDPSSQDKSQQHENEAARSPAKETDGWSSSTANNKIEK